MQNDALKHREGLKGKVLIASIDVLSGFICHLRRSELDLEMNIKFVRFAYILIEIVQIF